MNKRYFYIISLLGIISLSIISFSYASIEYPVKELGNCSSEKACKNYCDKPANSAACLDFAEKNNLMSADEIAAARKFLNVGSGPGGCTTKDSCETYCNSVSHIDECVSFAEKNGLMTADQLNEAKKVQAAMARGVKPPACGGKKQCDAYCSLSEHMEECITFAQEAGFMKPQELEDSKKVLAAIKAGVKPPPCQGKEACDVYCSQEEHFDACFDFALAAGFIDKKDAEMMKKTGGKGPGGCRGKKECDNFCQQDGNMEICAQFAFDNGMMTKDEFEMMKKTGGKGPGGCKSKEECQNFCNNPDNQETCFNFSKETGMIPAEDLKRMEEGKQQFKNAIQNMPPEVYSCLESTVGADTMAKFKNGEAMPPREIGDKMKECFEKNIPQGPGNDSPNNMGPQNMPPGNFQSGDAPRMTGPGGCSSPEECGAYCESHTEACRGFQPPQQQWPERYEGVREPSQFRPPQEGMEPKQCEGDNCYQTQFPPGAPPQFQQGAGGQMMLPAGSYIPNGTLNQEGVSPSDSFQYPPPPNQQFPGGESQPGTFVPSVPQLEQMVPINQELTPSLSPPPSSMVEYFVGTALNAFDIWSVFYQ